MTLPKRTVDEWLTVAHVSRPTKYLFCEGTSDASLALVSLDFPESLDTRIADEIAFEPEADELIGGNKQRVLAIVRAVDEQNANAGEGSWQFQNIRGLVDRDFEVMDHAAAGYVSPFAHRSDFANFYARSFEFPHVRNTLATGFNVVLTEDDWEQLSAAGRFSFAARYRSATSEAPRSAPELGRYIELSEGLIRFHKDRYVQAFFAVQGEPNTIIQNELSQIGANDEFRNFVNSHDMFSALAEVIRSKVGRGQLNLRQVYSALSSGLAPIAADQTVFDNLREWLAA